MLLRHFGNIARQQLYSRSWWRCFQAASLCRACWQQKGKTRCVLVSSAFWLQHWEQRQQLHSRLERCGSISRQDRPLKTIYEQQPFVKRMTQCMMHGCAQTQPAGSWAWPTAGSQHCVAMLNFRTFESCYDWKAAHSSVPEVQLNNMFCQGCMQVLQICTICSCSAFSVFAPFSIQVKLAPVSQMPLRRW